MRIFFTMLLALTTTAFVTAQTPVKQLPAARTTGTIKIDGDISEAAWKEATPATEFVEFRPKPGKVEDSTNKTVVYLLYDNTSIYIAGFCHERTKDSISRELIGRDRVGVNDFVGVMFDTYNDKINGVGFYVTPYGEQYDARYSGDGNEDDTWNSVWDSESKIHENGWSFEMRIPYSALRFVSRDIQTWGLNITRRRNKTGQQYMWNPIDPQKNGLINQEGEWTGIGKIEAPIRLSFSPYFSTYVNHYPAQKVTGNKNIKDVSASVNGGMDVKYGLSESFTLDVTLVPDFGQVPSDPQVLNLSPFEVQYQENRPFFIEGTELFSKGNLFYSRRIGGTPFNYGRAFQINSAVDSLLENPSQSKLVNAIKLSGRTKGGLGIGVFNAITKSMFAVVENKVTGEKRKVETGPLSNYNIVVFDQTLKNNSSVSFINTNVIRSGSSRDANVSAGLFNFNNKKNTYNWNGKFAVSKLLEPGRNNETGYTHNVGFGKTGGQFIFNITQELVNDYYNNADMGYFTTKNYLDHYMYMGYRWTKPGKWYNNLRINYNAGYSRTFKGNQYQSFYTNINANAQLKNLWFVGGFIGYNPEANDFYEAQTGGKNVFRASSRKIVEAWVESNSAKKYSFGASINGSHHDYFEGRSYYLGVYQKYRFSDRISVSHEISYQPFKNNVGFDGRDFSNGENIVFALRDRKTAENELEAKYSFNNKSGITLSIRHYWSEVDKKNYFLLGDKGGLSPYTPSYHKTNRSFNQFILFAEYTRQFAPGSFINVVLKNENVNESLLANHQYFKNLNHT
ncbi:MAG TPA: DUF5916 domain-containing protein, partial [Flavisolibacter sp.]|nr:DUF5916 domain-containing protein [Flavisolibacter sp.]